MTPKHCAYPLMTQECEQLEGAWHMAIRIADTLADLASKFYRVNVVTP